MHARFFWVDRAGRIALGGSPAGWIALVGSPAGWIALAAFAGEHSGGSEALAGP